MAQDERTAMTMNEGHTMSPESRIARVRRKAVWGSTATAGIAVLLGAASAILFSGCAQARQGDSASYLIVTSLTGSNGCGASGGAGSGSVLDSDVQCGTTTPPVFPVQDEGQATFQLALKDPGSDTSPTTPTTANDITLTQYHVDYTRTDGQNVQGVNVPYSFDGALTATVSGSTSVGFTLVRVQAKEEAPLAAMVGNNIPMTVLATVTFYGHDQVGRDVSVSGSIEITFANFSS
ncbi:MAG TPA: hypothetical protein VGL62_08135 [Vicinamibacterales bacterium]